MISNYEEKLKAFSINKYKYMTRKMLVLFQQMGLWAEGLENNCSYYCTQQLNQINYVNYQSLVKLNWHTLF